MIARVASMYYLEDMTQDQIAKQLGLSRPKVWRLLREAKETGLVEITVNLPPSLAMPVETELASRFGLAGAVLVADTRDEAAVRGQVGRAAAELLDRLLPDDGTLAIGMGRNVKAVSQQAKGLRPRRCTVVCGIGGSSQVGDGLNSTDIATRLADALGGKAEGIYAPAYAASEHVRDALLTHADISRTIARARSADLAIVGVGDAVDDSLVVSLGCITAADMARVRADGAVGDILGGFFDTGGEPVAAWIENRVVGLTRDDLRKIPAVIAVVAEEAKSAAVLGALNSGLVHTLVTSVGVARRVLKLADRPGSLAALQLGADRGQEPRRRRAVHRPMVDGQRQIQLRHRGDAAGGDGGPLDDATDSEDRGLVRVHDRLEPVDAEHAQVAQRHRGRGGGGRR
jgi:DNA-binding transcriptional regulator LsrR (DeoR family)